MKKAAAVAAVILASAFMCLPALAASGIEWKQESGKWQCWESQQKQLTGRENVPGWFMIDKKLYCFDASGNMYENTTTPDGYAVGADGAMTAQTVSMEDLAAYTGTYVTSDAYPNYSIRIGALQSADMLYPSYFMMYYHQDEDRENELVHGEGYMVPTDKPLTWFALNEDNYFFDTLYQTNFRFYTYTFSEDKNTITASWDDPDGPKSMEFHRVQ